MFDGLAEAVASVENILSGTGIFKIHTAPNEWYVCFGRPSEPCMIIYLNLAHAAAYFMTGNPLESCMPPPSAIQN